jgi:hypothetical protein
MDALIRQAISERRLVQFMYQGYTRIGEPHVYGRNDGVSQLLIYQTGGGSRSGRLPDWRRCDLPQITAFQLMNETFPGSRPNPSGRHSAWDQTFAIVG